MDGEKLGDIVILIAIICVLGWFIVFFATRVSEIKSLEVNPAINENKTIEATDMFSSNELHWNHMPLTYSVSDCSAYQFRRIAKAFNQIENETSGIISFNSITNLTEIDGAEYYNQIDSSSNIKVMCTNETSTQKIEDGYFISGYSSAYSQNKIITSANIVFYKITSKTYSSGCVIYPDIEIHEILHSLGFSHSENRTSIMYSEYAGCNLRIDRDIIEKLKEIYKKS
ncbi:MAG: matrixin family metalloprotease [Nanoarchaeota archaeon]|nr:matrixin family metalloprotease [Nanoarchaeota archaeon]